MSDQADGATVAGRHPKLKPMHDKTSLYVLVYEQLKELIISGELRPGERLLEDQIARSMNISKTPVREAVRKLSEEGLVTHKQRRTLTVVEFTEPDIREILTLRAELEAIALRQAAESLTHAFLDELDRRLGELKTLERQLNFHDLRRIDIERFHGFLVEQSGNRRLLEMWRTLSGQMLVLFQAVELRSKDAGYVWQNHAHLVQLLRDGSITEACNFLKSHILRNLEAIVEALRHANHAENPEAR